MEVLVTGLISNDLAKSEGIFDHSFNGGNRQAVAMHSSMTDLLHGVEQFTKVSCVPSELREVTQELEIASLEEDSGPGVQFNSLRAVPSFLFKDLWEMLLSKGVASLFHGALHV